MIGIATQHLLQKFFRRRFPVWAKLHLRLQKQRCGFLPELQVVVEQQHGGQRRGKEINLRFGFMDFTGIGQQFTQYFFAWARWPSFSRARAE